MTRSGAVLKRMTASYAGSMLARRVLPLLTLVASFGCHASSGKSSSDTTTERTTQPIARTPEQIRLAGNHLLGAASAYLQQHAHNPVDWYPWGAEALALAVKLDRPIFLSIGYVSCHWCHVMEKEVFEQDDVAAFLNEHFISIKVDREERPDLDAVYMAAVQAMTGSGGWPMTTFLTPSLRPFFGGTYLPHDRFLQAIRAGAEQFSSERNQVENHGADVYARIAASEPSTARATLALADLHAIARESLANVDASAGGFRGRTKFPTPIKWRFLLDAYRKWGDADLAQAVKRTLDAMATGGLRDQVAGGFFRYGTEPSWTIPHFEKMLYDNAQLGALYLEAAAAFSEPRYRAIGLDTLDFILSDMQPSARGFGASFDADAAGKEGSTYLWTRAELSSVLGATDGQAVADLLAITEPGNFEGSNVPTLRGSDSARPDNLKLWLRCRPKLVAARRRRPQPAFDSKRVTAWNGLAIGALALGYRASGELRFREAAERAADVIWRLNRSPTGELARTSNGERAGSSAVLDDYAFFADGLLELFQATSQAAYLEQAISLTTQANERFAKPAGGWFLTSGSGEEPLGRRSEIDDGVEPSGNAVMIRVLEELAALTGRNDFTTLAERALEQYASTIQQRNIDMAGWLDDALLAAGPYYELVIAGIDSKLAATWNGLLPAWTVGVRFAAPGPSAELRQLLPTLADKRDRDGRALAYVCQHGACLRPQAESSALESELLAGWLH